jgi:(p)ppGpp synthase/HD superfamily hydrolase
MMKEELIKFAKKYYDDISHPLAVANQFPEMSDEWIVGLFHDILEDTNINKDFLFCLLTLLGKYKLFDEIVKMTRRKGETYFEYIRRLDGIAKKVKIADIKHNLSRTETLQPSLKKRYEKALKILLDDK